MDFPEYSSFPGFGSSPWIVSFNRDEPEVLIDPFNGRLFEASLPILEGKPYLRCCGDWFLMFDEGSRECFLANIASNSTVSLPPLLHPTDSLGGFALSSQNPPDCTVMFASCIESDKRFVFCCRPGDKEWKRHGIDLGNSGDVFGEAICGSKGKMFVETFWRRTRRCVVINTSTSGSYDIEKLGIVQPDIFPVDGKYVTFWVESNGDIFLVRVFLLADQAVGVANIDVYRMDTLRYVWRRVDSIGGATFFLGANCVAVSSQAGGTQADCIYLLLWCYDGIRLYTIRMDDQTISFTLVPACTAKPEDLSDTWCNLFWVIFPSYRQEPTKSSGTITSKINTSVPLMEDKEQMSSPWSRLPVELIELLIPKLSFVDYLRTRAVCKEWSLIDKPIQHARTHPMLMSIRAKSGGICRFYDPMVEKEYIANDSMLIHGNWQTLQFSKYGWVLATKGKRCIYATNPFTREVCKLPKVDRLWFDGISFSSVPKSPDSIIFAIRKYPCQDTVSIMLWRAGDNRWTKEELPCDAMFWMNRSNPLFFGNEFYCLGVLGNLGVFNPKDMTWRVLGKPEPLNLCGDRFCHLVEFKGDLIATFRPYDANPIEMFKLDRSQMSWEKVLQLDGAVLFLDNRNATIKSSQGSGCNNRIYLPFFGSSEGGDHKASAFYDLEDGHYKPEFYGLTEPINSLWIEPNFNRHL